MSMMKSSLRLVQSLGVVARRTNNGARSVGFAGSRWMSDDAAATSDDRIHSTDIAFKPAESGWGGTRKYSSNFDKIFGNKNQAQGNDATGPTATDSSTSGN
ncbi:expressed unknown protein [Seminavis robusta]|uniref:Uncharacterized protein n=1 Tax=Seminavis robusta TaxID=568900 RepID=A0A9N8EUK9_9STRA|nr:expressed unknown protein [Seminavis robusta]|eukprot:Sro1733_g294220.1 n/a (101) ;mRNA; f:4064-4468